MKCDIDRTTNNEFIFHFLKYRTLLEMTREMRYFSNRVSNVKRIRRNPDPACHLIKLSLPPGPVGIYLNCILTEGILSVVTVEKTSPCRDKVQTNDILFSINDLEVSKLGLRNSLKYLKERQWESKNLVFKRRPVVPLPEDTTKMTMESRADFGGEDKKSPMVLSPTTSHSILEDSSARTCTSNPVASFKTQILLHLNDNCVNNQIRGTSNYIVAENSSAITRKIDDCTRNNSSSGCMFQLHVDPGPLGLNIKSRGPLGFEVVHVKLDSQCKGKVQKGDYMVSIDDLALCNLTNDYVQNYLSTRILLNKTITVKRRNASPNSSVQSGRLFDLDQDEQDDSCDGSFNVSHGKNYLKHSKPATNVCCAVGASHEVFKEIDNLNNQDKNDKTHVFSLPLKRQKNDQDKIPENKGTEVVNLNCDLHDETHPRTAIFHDLTSNCDPVFDPSIYSYQELVRFKQLSEIICNEMERREVSRLDEIARRVFDEIDE